MKLTKKQSLVLYFISAYELKNNEFPTLQEIKEGCQFNTVSNAAYFIFILMKKKMIKKTGRSWRNKTVIDNKEKKPNIQIGRESIESLMLVEIYSRINGHLPDMEAPGSVGITSMCRRYLELCGTGNKYPHDEYYMLALRKTS